MPFSPPIDREHLARLLQLAREEDLGAAGDLTSRLLPETWQRARGAWLLVARRAGRLCGREIMPDLLAALAPEVGVAWFDGMRDGASIQPGDRLARFEGLAAQMLAAERILLNFLQHLSGVATLTARFVSAVAGTHAKIYDTRKTTPGLRALEKYAVRCGGGHNHRSGLYDAVLIKDNHLAGIPASRLAHAVFEMLNRLETLPSQPAFVEVECDGLDQFAELLKVVGIDLILLDNFTLDDLRRAVEMRDRAGLRGKVELEASGQATLENVRAIAGTGVERIAVGAVTHSAPILDLGIDVV
jgi:nicotinate-nucleotide pyrophosphorylase (carboxylating)